MRTVQTGNSLLCKRGRILYSVGSWLDMDIGIQTSTERLGCMTSYDSSGSLARFAGKLLLPIGKKKKKNAIGTFRGGCRSLLQFFIVWIHRSLK